MSTVQVELAPCARRATRRNDALGWLDKTTRDAQREMRFFLKAPEPVQPDDMRGASLAAAHGRFLCALGEEVAKGLPGVPD